MEKYPKAIKLKTGQNVIIRLLKEDDLDQLVTFFQSLNGEDRQFLRIDVMNRADIYKRYSKIKGDTVFSLIALNGNQIIAEGSLFRYEFGWKRKLGEIRLVISQNFQRKGLGSILTRELFLYALTTDLHKVQAEIMENQESAVAAFARMGFNKETILKKHVTDINGERRDLVIMSLDIQDLWAIMEDFIHDRIYVT